MLGLKVLLTPGNTDTPGWKALFVFALSSDVQISFFFFFFFLFRCFFVFCWLVCVTDADNFICLIL